MMSGELEFEDIFYGDIPIKYPVTAHILFLSFVLLVTVILTNLMVGLAVNDIQGLQVSASLDRLIRQAELVSRLESLFFSRLLRNSPERLLALCKRSALLRTSRNQLQFNMRPNDPRDKQLPEELKINIYKLVAERRDRNQSVRQQKFENNCCFFNKTLLSHELERCQKPVTPPTILRPRSATNVPNHLQNLQNAETAKPNISTFADIRQDVHAVKAQLKDLSNKLDKLSDGVEKQFNAITEELERIKTAFERRTQFYF